LAKEYPSVDEFKEVSWVQPKNRSAERAGSLLMDREHCKIFPSSKQRRIGMRTRNSIILAALVSFVRPQVLSAQAFGEYGRASGGVGGRQSSANSKAAKTQSQNKGKAIIQGVGDLGGRPVPSSLIVASKKAALYPRQDDETEKIAELVQGDALIPMAQSNGGNDWYMVKTQKGMIGWIRSSDVSKETYK